MVCREFYEAYHSLIPKTEGFEARQEVYKLFFHLYHLYVPPPHQLECIILSVWIQALEGGCHSTVVSFQICLPPLPPVRPNL